MTLTSSLQMGLNKENMLIQLFGKLQNISYHKTKYY
jgi:hypothetical protein